MAQSLFATILILSGGLKSLQTVSIIAAFSFIFIMLLACVSMLKSFREETIVKNKISKELTVSEIDKGTATKTLGS